MLPLHSREKKMDGGGENEEPSVRLQRICICHDPNSEILASEDVPALTCDRFQRLSDCASARKKFKSAKYRSIVRNFPVNYNSNVHGAHSKCYKNFSAVPSKDLASHHKLDSSEKPVAQVTRQREQGVREEGRILEKKCIFCKMATKKYNYRKQPLHTCSTVTFEENLRRECTTIDDFQILRCVGDKDFVAAEVCYHDICRKNFYNVVAAQSKPTKTSTEGSEWTKKRQAHKIALSQITAFLQSSVLEKDEIVSFSHLFNLYENILIEYECHEDGFLQQHLKLKLLKKFGDKINIESDKHATSLVYKKGGEILPAVRAKFLADEEKKSEEAIIRKAGFIVRNAIKAAAKIPSQSFQLSPHSDEIPHMVKTLIDAIYLGPRATYPIKPTPRMLSVASDMVFQVSSGRIVPSKQLLLGMGIKTMTGRKEVLKILNRLGHSINYTTAQEVETNLGDTIIANDRATPEGIMTLPHLKTCVAFDNYDERTETLSGKGQLHETVGVIFQEKSVSEDNSVVEIERPKGKKRKMNYSITDLELHQKSTVASNVWSEKEDELPSSYFDAIKRDRYWTFAHFFRKQGIPMWGGFNSKTVVDKTPIQKVEYLKNYEQSPNDPSMILETLKVAEKIRQECGQRYMLVTYDLLMAKPAMEIQLSLKPAFDKLVVTPGPFHTACAYFSALGKMVDESGWGHILCESGVLAENSLRAVLLGKTHDRCKRLHTMMALSLQLQHIKYYLACCEGSEFEREETWEVENYLNIFLENKEPPEEPQEVTSFFQRYEIFCNATRSGEHGATAQFWMTYIDLVHLYLQQSRAVRMNDIQLFTCTLSAMTDIFFVTNHPNYARWMVRYTENLKAMDTEYPGLREILQTGNFGLSVRRTTVPFSGTPTDQTLEHTINRDAASRLTGISSMTNESAAHLRWTLTRSTRARLVRAMKDMAGITDADDACIETTKSRIDRDNADINSICSVMEESANPFKQELNRNCLYNLGTGKVASQRTMEFLLNIREVGSNMKHNFIQECKEDNMRFNKKISRQQIFNFASEGVKFKSVLKDNRVKELGLACGIFGRLCSLAVREKLDLAYVLQYSLTSLPLSLVHIDGTMKKTEKSKLLNYIESKISSSNASLHPDCEIIDALFYFHTLPNRVPDTYGEISKYIIEKICTSKAREIHVVFDQYKSPSIKDTERSRREVTAGDSHFIIQGGHQKSPRDFKQALRNEHFKTMFTQFLGEDWKSRGDSVGNKTFYFTINNKAYRLTSGEKAEEVESLTYYEEEADARLYFHYNFHLNNQNSFIQLRRNETEAVIRTGDTDVLLICLANLPEPQPITASAHRRLWLDFGVGKNRRQINVSKLAQELGTNIRKALPGFHAFTGSDCTAAFSNKGKVRPFKLLEKSVEYQEAFKSLGQSKIVPRSTYRTLEKFTCDLYGEKKITEVNLARLRIFEKITSGSKKTPLANIKKIEPSSLPPCQSVLNCKILRSNYQGAIWNNATRCHPTEGWSPLESGWEEIENRLRPLWNSAPPLPPSLTLDETDEIEAIDDEKNDDIDINFSSDDDDNDEEADFEIEENY